MMFAPFLNRFKKAIPFFICVLLMFLGQIPNIFLFSVPFTFILIFYFAIFNSSLLNGWSCFVLGLLTDLITQTPFGLNSFLFVLLFFAANINRLFLSGLSFDKLWQFFSWMMILFFLLRFFIFALCASTVILPTFLIGQYIILILSYPLLIKTSGRLDNWIGETT